MSENAYIVIDQMQTLLDEARAERDRVVVDLDRIESSMAVTIEVLRGERELFLRQRDEALVSRDEAWAQRDRLAAALREIAGAHISLVAYQLRSRARGALAELEGSWRPCRTGEES